MRGRLASWKIGHGQEDLGLEMKDVVEAKGSDGQKFQHCLASLKMMNKINFKHKIMK